MKRVHVILTLLLTITLLLLPPLSEGVGFEIYVPHDPSSRSFNSGSENWCYDEPKCDQDHPNSDWNLGACRDGTRQSPINFEMSSGNILELSEKDCPIDFGMTPDDGYNLMEYHLQNFGKTLHIHSHDKYFPSSNFRFPNVDDGTYTLAQVHFHKGLDDTKGSEHLINGKQYPLEMHMVHYRSGGANNATSDKEAVHLGPGGLAVIAFLFDVDPSAPSGVLDDFVPVIQRVPNATDEVFVDDTPFLMRDEIRKQTQAYHYEGSLTTPGCNEVVEWIMMKDPIIVKPEVVQKFREVSGQVNTFRRPQDLKGRKIKILPLFH